MVMKATGARKRMPIHFLRPRVWRSVMRAGLRATSSPARRELRCSRAVGGWRRFFFGGNSMGCLYLTSFNNLTIMDVNKPNIV
jgi:hypothetical protein